LLDTNIKGLKIATLGMTTEPMPVVYEPLFGVVVQGAKRTVLGSRVFEHVEGQYFVVSLEVPITSQIVSATDAEPYMAVSLKLKPPMIATLLLEVADSDIPTAPFSGLGVGQASGELLEAVVRLLHLLDRPRDRTVLAPLVEREILWYLLCGEQRAIVRQVGLADPRLSQISQAIRWIRTNYSKPLRIEELAEMVAMSVSSFHRHFRVATAMTPIQYLKQVRLQEARSRLMVQPEDVAAMGFAVGYDSPSQFSRKYSRLSPRSARTSSPRTLSAGRLPRGGRGS
jgi:AraC-like DNA-binding protein